MALFASIASYELVDKLASKNRRSSQRLQNKLHAYQLKIEDRKRECLDSGKRKLSRLLMGRS